MVLLYLNLKIQDGQLQYCGIWLERHALLTGRNYITLEDVPIVAKTVLSTAQTDRVSVFYLLLDNDGDVSTDDIMTCLSVARPTALRTMTET